MIIRILPKKQLRTFVLVNMCDSGGDCNMFSRSPAVEIIVIKRIGNMMVNFGTSSIHSTLSGKNPLA